MWLLKPLRSKSKQPNHSVLYCGWIDPSYRPSVRAQNTKRTQSLAVGIVAFGERSSLLPSGLTPIGRTSPVGMVAFYPAANKCKRSIWVLLACMMIAAAAVPSPIRWLIRLRSGRGAALLALETC